VIAGYTCFKAIATLEDGTQTEMWFTKDIAANTKGQQYFNKDMPGFPMEYTVSQQGMTIKMTVTDISKTVDKKAFDMKVPDGYQVKTMDEMKSMGGQ
jgi:GLPGLI family protein